MAAQNKQQALANKRKRETSYGAEPGESTKGLKPGDRVYDPDTNTWQLKEPEDDMSAYIDTVLNAAGMSDVQGSAKGTGGSGSGSGGKSSEASATPEDERAIEEATRNGIGLEEIAAGAIGAGAALVAQRMLRKKPGYVQGPQTPAGDTAGVADVGGQGVPKAPVNTAQGFDDVYAMFDVPAALPPPMRALPGPQEFASPAMEDVADLRGRGFSAPPLLTGSLDGQFAAVDGPNMPLADPEVEAALQAYAEQIRGGQLGDPAFDANQAFNPSLHPDVPNMDPAIMARLKAILAGAM